MTTEDQQTIRAARLVAERFRTVQETIGVEHILSRNDATYMERARVPWQRIGIGRRLSDNGGETLDLLRALMYLADRAEPFPYIETPEWWEDA